MYDVNTCFVQAHIEMQESLAGAQKDTLEGLQESTIKMMSQQAEAAQYTADAARHIKEVSYHSLALLLYFLYRPNNFNCRVLVIYQYMLISNI